MDGMEVQENQAQRERERLRDEERLLPEEGEKQSERKIRYIHIERRIG